MMTIEQAEDIIRQVGSAISNSPFDDDHWMCWAKPLTDLPCSIGMVKYAFFKYAEYLVKENLIFEITDDARGLPITETMITVYGMLVIFRENSDEINQAAYKLHKNPNKYSDDELSTVEKKLSKKFGVSRIYGRPSGDEDIIEFNNFLADMQNNYSPNEFKESDHPFLAYSNTLESNEYRGVSKLAWDKETSNRLGL